MKTGFVMDTEKLILVEYYADHGRGDHYVIWANPTTEVSCVIKGEKMKDIEILKITESDFKALDQKYSEVHSGDSVEIDILPQNVYLVTKYDSEEGLNSFCYNGN
ncbi:hypothetical protein AVL50_12960 [Flammeovirga sp. SJP92]|nr:hypothetical protein AVL50_12960 [Flammeovirga sp. SJP92]